MNRTVTNLSIIIICLSVLASGIGLLSPAIYNDNSYITAVWFGNDMVTMFLA